MDENINGVEQQETAEPAEVIEQPTGEEAGTATPQLTDNQRWATARKRAEREAQAKIDAANRERDELLGALRDAGLNVSSTQDIILQLKAQRDGVPFEQLKAQADAQAAEIERRVNAAPEVLEAKRIVQEQKMASDYAAVKAAYPDIKAGSVEELGETFIALMAAAEKSGISIDPVTAYEAQLAQEKRTTKPVPPSMGSAKGTAPAEKEIYTSAELDALTSKQLDDPAIFEKAYRSMLGLK